MTRKTLITATLFFAVAPLFLSACSGDSETPQTEAGIPVEVAVARLSPIAQAYRYSGTVRGTRRVELGTRMLGRVTFLTVEEGDRVRRGETLVRLQSQDIRAQRSQVLAGLTEASATLANAETNYRRMQALYESDSATRKELDDAAVHYETALARVAAMEARLVEVDEALDDAVLTAPFDGFVVRRMAEQGDLASPGRPLLTIEDTRALEVVAQVPENDILRFAEGDTVNIEVGSVDGSPIPGTVTQINPSGDAETRQFDVIVTVDDTDNRQRIRSGMFARIELRKGERSVISVPEVALHRRGQLTGLCAVDADGRALLRWVRTGRQIGDRVEVLSGLAEGEIFVVSSQHRIADGQRVQVLSGASAETG
jgi:RND family efflux transporter MFP subunit